MKAKTSNKICAFLLALVMLFGLIPTTLFSLGDEHSHGGAHLLADENYTLNEGDTYTDGWDGTVADGFGGLGTDVNPYLIYTAEELAYLAASVNSGTSYIGNHFKLMSDLDLGGLEWTPIGYSGAWSFSNVGNKFKGHFDGNFHTVYNLSINKQSNESFGLFGSVENASVKNLAVKGATVNVHTSISVNASPLIGKAVNATVESCYVDANVCVSCPDNCLSIGLLVGYANGITVTNSYATGSLQGISSYSDIYVGGLAGVIEEEANEITNCYFSGSVCGETPSVAYVGGVVGLNNTSNYYANILNTANTFAISTVYSSSGNADAFFGTGYYTPISAANSYYSSNIASSYANESYDLGSADWLVKTLGWDFESVWAFDPEAMYAIPILRGFSDSDIITPDTPDEPEIPDTPVNPDNVDTWDGTVAGGFSGGSGSEYDPYLIYTAEELAYLAQSVNCGTTYSGRFFKLMSNLDLCGLEWTPIGSSNSDKGFSGEFNGNGYAISNFTVSRSSNNNLGLFGILQDAFIANLAVKDYVINASSSTNTGLDVGTIAGKAISSTVVGCSVTGTISVSAPSTVTVKVGGLLGIMSQTNVENSYANVTITLNSSSVARAGGLVGLLGGNDGYSYISNSYAIFSCNGSTGVNCNLAGLIGLVWFGTVEVSNSFAVVDSQNSSINGLMINAVGNDFYHAAYAYNTYFASAQDYYLSSSYGTSASCSNFQSASWLINYLGWDFESVWTFDAESDYSYPVLQGLTSGGYTPEECEHEWRDANCYEPMTCTKCGKTEGEPIGHLEQTFEGTSPTCSAPGYTESVICLNCGTVITPSVEIPATGKHDDYDSNGFCDYCGTETSVIVPGTGKILVVQNGDPWGNDGNYKVMNDLYNNGYIIGYDIVNTSDFQYVNLSEYAVIHVVTNSDTMSDYAADSIYDKVVAFANAGGTVIYSIAWQSSYYSSMKLPLGVKAVHYTEYYANIADKNHPIITGILTGGNSELGSSLYGNSINHSYILNETLPDDAHIILTSAETGYATLVEFSCGSGNVIISCQTWECFYKSTYEDKKVVFSNEMYDDLYVYALTLSSGGYIPEECEHEWRDATCTSPMTCTKCGRTEGEPIGHLEQTVEGMAPTCSDPGYTESVICLDCGAVITPSSEIPATGKHDDYDSNGYCDYCGKLLNQNPGSADAWDGSVAGGFGGGIGTSESPYLIYTAEQFAFLADAVNSGNSFSGYYFKLMSDLDLGGNEWTPIGHTNNVFSGNFDGNNHVIYNLTINKSFYYVGLFGRTSGATVTRLGLKNVSISTYYYGNSSGVGALIGMQDGGVTSYCFMEGSISTKSDDQIATGGLIGILKAGTLSNSYAISTVTLNTSSYAQCGGLIGATGWNHNEKVSVEYCFALSTVTAKGKSSSSYAGGLIGSNYAPSCYVRKCFTIKSYVTSNYVAKALLGQASKTPTFSLCYYADSNASDSYGSWTELASLQSEDWIVAALGWDFNTVWTFDAESGYEYPVLRGFTSGGYIPDDCMHDYVDGFCTKCGESDPSYVPECEHEWRDATCTSPMTCTKCGITEGEPTTHSYYVSDYVYPTCSTDGYTLYVCDGCGISYMGDVVSRYGHVTGKWIVDKPASCTESGVKHTECQRCGKTLDNVYISATGHNYVSTVTREASCTEAGIITHTCANCNNSYVTYVYSEHSYSLSSHTDAACEYDGKNVYACSKCGDSYEEIIPGGHAYTAEITKIATENEDGEISYSCTKCGSSYTEIIPKRPDASILLIQDSFAWNENSNATMLNSLVDRGLITSWDITTTSALSAELLMNYSIIFIANDQSSLTYERLKSFNETIESFARAGGVVIYGASDSGWGGGNINYSLPGGVIKGNYYSNRNYITNKTHNVVTGILTDAKALTDELLYGTYCSHSYFTNLPEGAVVILSDANGRPTLVEYPLGDGYVIASGLTWEYSYVRNLACGTSFAKVAYDDLILHAATLSNPCDHVFDEGYFVEPTCKDGGYVLHTCESCGMTMKDGFVEKLAHPEGEWQITKEPTEYESGLKELLCPDCGDTLQSEVLPMLDAPVTKIESDGVITVGKQTQFTVSVENARSVKYIEIVLNFDLSVFELVSIEWLIDGASISIDLSSMKATASWESETAPDGPILTFILKAKSTCDTSSVGAGVSMSNGENVIGLTVVPKNVETVPCYHENRVITESSEIFHILRCSECGNEVPEVHSYSNAIIDEKYFAKGETCTDGAKYYYSCECGAHGTEMFESEPKDGEHSFGDWITVIEASWKNEGTNERACDKCGEVETEKTDKVQVLNAMEIVCVFGDTLIGKKGASNLALRICAGLLSTTH